MGTGWSIAVAAVFVWLGMVLGISFLEAPLKFRAPGVTQALGLGIGRLVFRALTVCEAVLAAAALLGLLAAGGRSVPTWTAFLAAMATLAVQVLLVRPVLTRRSDAVLSGSVEAGSARSGAHYAYVGLEVIKVIALVATGVLLLQH